MKRILYIVFIAWVTLFFWWYSREEIHSVNIETKRSERDVSADNSKRTLGSIDIPTARNIQKNTKLFLNKEKYIHLELLDSDEDHFSRFTRHRAILQYLKSPRKNDPEYMEVMLHLLNHGYGIDEWPATVNTLLDLSLMEKGNRHRLREEGLSDIEIEEAIEKLPEKIPQMFDRCRTILRDNVGIEDQDLIEALMEIRLPFNNGEYILGHPDDLVVKTGDMFLTDEDWFTPQFRAVMSGE